MTQDQPSLSARPDEGSTSQVSAARPLPSYSDLMTSLDGCMEHLGRLVDAVRGLFDSAGAKTGYDEAVAELQAAHNAAIDWCKQEARRHA